MNGFESKRFDHGSKKIKKKRKRKKKLKTHLLTID